MRKSLLFPFYGKDGEDRTRDLTVHKLTSCRRGIVRKYCRLKMLRNKCYSSYCLLNSFFHHPLADCWLAGVRGGSATWEDKVPSLDQKSFHAITSPTHRGRKRWSPWSIPPRAVWKPPTHWLIADWLGFVEPAPPGEDKIQSRIRYPSIHLQPQHTGDDNGGLPGQYRPA